MLKKHLSHLLLACSAALMASLTWAQSANPLAGTQWQLRSIAGESVTLERPPTLIFGAEDDSAGGHGGCNAYGSSYRVEGDTIGFEGVFSTMMACQDDLMQVESALFNALQSATQYEVSEGQLIIRYGEEQALVFEMLSLVNSTWTLVSLNGEAVQGDTPLTLQFNDQGQVAGNTGCNQFMGTYTNQGEQLSFSPLASTKRACVENTLAQQEQAYLNALQNISRHGFTMSTLTLTSDAGDVLEFSRTYTLVGTSWRLQSLGGEAVIATEGITLSFDEAGTVSGLGGCNSFGGSYTLADNTILFSPLVSTEMACVDEAIMQQEQAFYEALASLTGYEQDAKQLRLFYGEGQVLVFDLLE